MRWFLQSHGYLMARFTGSEVWNNPEDCLNSVNHLALFNTINETKKHG